jgi:SAM-dependent methyltransferase
MREDEYQIMFEVEDAHWWYRSLRGVLDLFWRRYVKDGVDCRRALAVLDVGCGTGAVLKWLSGHAQPCGVDFSIEAVRFCRGRGQERCAVGSAMALPCARGAFDVVVSFDVLCHRSIPDKLAPLREMRGVLKEGGLLFLNLPAYQWLLSSHDAAVYTNHRFTRSEVVNMLRVSGFEPLAVTHWNTLLFPIILVVRLWRKLVAPAQSDLAGGTSPVSNAVLSKVLGLERALMRLVMLPFGLSIFVAARKT